MNEGKMREVFAGLEDQQATKVPEDRVCLSSLRDQGAARKGPKAGILAALPVIIGIVTALLVALWAFPAARAARGYTAVGGEALLVLFSGAISGYMSAYLMGRSN